jgi:hypothetical protein
VLLKAELWVLVQISAPGSQPAPECFGLTSEERRVHGVSRTDRQPGER